MRLRRLVALATLTLALATPTLAQTYGISGPELAGRLVIDGDTVELAEVRFTVRVPDAE